MFQSLHCYFVTKPSCPINFTKTAMPKFFVNCYVVPRYGMKFSVRSNFVAFGTAQRQNGSPGCCGGKIFDVSRWDCRLATHWDFRVKLHSMIHFLCARCQTRP